MLSLGFPHFQEALRLGELEQKKASGRQVTNKLFNGCDMVAQVIDVEPLVFYADRG
jgi:hypothetical protein